MEEKKIFIPIAATLLYYKETFFYNLSNDNCFFVKRGFFSLNYQHLNTRFSYNNIST